MDPAGRETSSRYQKLVTDGCRCIAVHAPACNRTGIVAAKTYIVGRSCRILIADHSFIDITDQFVRACDHIYMFRSVNQGSDPVAGIIDIIEMTVDSQGIGAHEEVVGTETLMEDFLCIIGMVSVIDSIVLIACQPVQNTGLFQGLGTAETDA